MIITLFSSLRHVSVDILDNMIKTTNTKLIPWVVKSETWSVSGRVVWQFKITEHLFCYLMHLHKINKC